MAGTEFECDVIVVGAGASGENAAGRAAAAGLKVVVIEEDLVGGACSYWACIPSKALLRPGEALDEARRAPGAAAAAGGTLDAEAALARRDYLAEPDDTSQVRWLADAGAHLIRGHARLIGPRQLQVSPAGMVVAATRAVVIATGSRPSTPALFEGVAHWGSKQATTSHSVPSSLLVVGGGAVGCEMAQAWHSLGTRRVTIVEAGERLLSREEPFAGEALAAAFSRIGIEVHTGAEVAEVDRPDPAGPVSARLSDGSRLAAAELLVAAGRRPRTDDLGLETVGLEPGKPIEVDDHLRAVGVAGGWLYAVGDVNGRALFTHAGKYQARIAGDHIAGREGGAWGDRVALPRVIFTDPAVAAVGLTEAQARTRGLRVGLARRDMDSVAASAVVGEGVGGAAQLVIDQEGRVIVGATFVGPGVEELLHAATVAIVGRVTLDELWHAIPAFPTRSEIWLRLLEGYGL